MKAIRFHATLPRYLFGMAARRLAPYLLWSGLSCTSLVDIPEPSVPGPAWGMLQTRYGGICGSDMATIFLDTSPYYSAISQTPLIFGHENTGRIAQPPPGTDFQPGERVVVEPLLWCRPRGFSDLCANCARGEINRCLRMTSGSLAPGLFNGTSLAASGSWSAFYPAHPAQLLRLPDAVSDENALLVEPFAVALHAVLQHYPQPGQRILLIGAGTIGLCTLAALRVLGCQQDILVLARYPFQAEAARRLGASQVLLHAPGQDILVEAARLLGMQPRRPLLGRAVPVGSGAELVFECVGSRRAIDDALRLARPGGQVVLVGVPGAPFSLDWNSILLKELSVSGAFGYHHAERWQGQAWRTFDLALQLLASGQLDLSWLVTHRFSIEQYSQAFQVQQRHAAHQAIKSVFAF